LFYWRNILHFYLVLAKSIVYLQGVKEEQRRKGIKYINMKRLIKLDDTEARKKITKHFGVSGANLSQALNFKRNSKAAIAMRSMALEDGGILFEEVKK